MTYDIQASFANASDNSVITIPSGTYEIVDTLSLDKNFVTINADGAIIKPAALDWTGKPLVNLSGATRPIVNGLYVESSIPNMPLAGLALGRKEGKNGGGGTFIGCNIVGSYQIAPLYSVASETNSFYGCNFVTTNDKPAELNTSVDITGLGLIEESNVCHYHYGCSWRNYGTATSLIQLMNYVSEFIIRDGYFVIGENCIGIKTNNDVNSIVIDTLRAEGTGANSLLLKSDAYVQYLDISKITWMIASDYVIEFCGNVINANLDFMTVSRSSAFLNISAGQTLRSRIFGDKIGGIVLTGGQLRNSIIRWFSENPIVGDMAIDNSILSV